MKNVNRKIGVLALAITMATLLSSCSKQMMSINHANKLDNVQTLANSNALPAQKESEIPARTSTPTLATENSAIILPNNRNIDISSIPVKKAVQHSLVQTLSKKAGKEIMKQANVIKNLAGQNHSIASVSKKMDGGGLLGLAITLLIIGIVLFFLGFSSLGALFWTIGIVLLVIALVFFILWMIGRAVSN